jgi:hypothetical protein
MLTMQDCIELSDLTEDEILAIAEHEHLPEMAGRRDGLLPVPHPRRRQAHPQA